MFLKSVMPKFQQFLKTSFKVVLLLPIIFIGIFYYVSLRNGSAIKIRRTFASPQKRFPHSSLEPKFAINSTSAIKEEKKVLLGKETNISKVSTNDHIIFTLFQLQSTFLYEVLQECS